MTLNEKYFSGIFRLKYSVFFICSGHKRSNCYWGSFFESNVFGLMKFENSAASPSGDRNQICVLSSAAAITHSVSAAAAAVRRDDAPRHVSQCPQRKQSPEGRPPGRKKEREEGREGGKSSRDSFIKGKKKKKTASISGKNLVHKQFGLMRPTFDRRMVRGIRSYLGVCSFARFPRCSCCFRMFLSHLMWRGKV